MCPSKKEREKERGRLTKLWKANLVKKGTTRVKKVREDKDKRGIKGERECVSE